MKNLFTIIFSLVFIQSVLAEVPTCQNIGTRSEGWYLNGRLLAWDNCSGESVCQAKDKDDKSFSDGICLDSCQTLCNVSCQEVCKMDCRIVNGEQVCEESCQTICPEVCNVTCSRICD